jgi:hypothetical protein
MVHGGDLRSSFMVEHARRRIHRSGIRVPLTLPGLKRLRVRPVQNTQVLGAALSALA